MRSISRNLKLALVIGGALICLSGLLAASLALYLATPAGAERTLEFVNQSLPGRISAAQVAIDPLKASVRLTRARLSDPEGRTVISSPQVDLRCRLWPLLRKRLVIERLDLRQAQAWLELDAAGQLNLVRAFKKPDAPKSDFVVEIKALRAERATLSFATYANRLRLGLAQAELQLAARFGQGYELKLALPAGRLSCELADGYFELGQITSCFTLNPAGLSDLNFSAAHGSSRLNLSGGLSTPGKQLRARCDFDIEPGDFVQQTERPGRFKGWLTAGGTLDRPEIRTRLDHTGGRYRNVELGAGQLSAALDNRQLRLDYLKADFANGRLSLKGQADLGQAWPTGSGQLKPAAIAYRLEMNAQQLELRALPAAPQQLRGKLDADARFKGQGLDRLDFSANIKARNLSYAERLKPTDLKLATSGHYASKRLEFAMLDASTAGAQLHARGSLDLASQTAAAVAELRVPDLQRLLKPYGQPARGALRLNAAIGGSLKKPQARLKLEGRDLGYAQAKLGRLESTGLLDQAGWLEVTSFNLTNRASNLKATGRLRIFENFPHLPRPLAAELTATAENLDPQDFWPASPVTARIDGQLTASSRGRRLTAATRLKGHNLAYGAVELGTFDLNAELNDNWLELSSLSLTKPGSLVKAQGRLQLNPHTQTVTAIDALSWDGHIDLMDFDRRSNGRIEVMGAFSGTPAALNGQARLHGDELEIRGQKIANADLNASIAGRRIAFDPVSVELKAGQSIDGTAWLDLDGSYAFKLVSHNLRLEDLAALQNRGSFSGQLAAEIQGRGQIKNPNLQASLNLRELSYARTTQESEPASRPQALPDAAIELKLAERVLNAQGRLNFDFDARYNLKTRRYAAGAVFDETALAPYLNLLGLPQLSGELSGRLQAEGRGHDLAGLKARARIRVLDIDQRNRNLLSARDFGLSLEQGRLDLPLTRFELAEQGRLDLSATGELPDRLELAATGDIPASVLIAFGDEFEDAGGRLNFTAQSEILKGRPRLAAEIEIQDLSATLCYNGQRFEQVNGRISVRNERASLHALAGHLDGGAFTAGGSLKLAGLRPRELDLEASSRSLPLVIPETMDLKVDSNLHLTATPTQAHLAGRVNITDGCYYKDVQASLFSNVLGSLIRPAPPRLKPAASPWLERTSLDIEIERRGSLRVENNLAELELNPNLQIGGTLANPLINGRVTVTSGTVTYQGREFTVTHGDIDFLNPARTQARVDIQSQTKVRDWTIYLNLKGPLDALELSLVSEPSENQTDILSLLLVGKTTGEMTANQEAVGLSPAAMLAELLTSTYAGEIKTTTSLDIFKLESNEFSAGGTNNLKLTLGKEISRRLTLKYEIETKDSAASQRGIAEYKLLDTLYLNGYQGSSGSFGADIQYRYEFR